MDGNSTQNGSPVQPSNTSIAEGQNLFPSSDDTRLDDISALLEGAPVIPAKSKAGSAKASNAIATADDFAEVEEEKPFSRKLGPKALFAAALSAAIILPMSVVFLGGGGNSNNEEEAVEVDEASEEGGYVSVEDYEAQQAELEQLRSQLAFTEQQVDAEAIDAAGRQQAQQEAQANAAQANASRSTSPSATARPTPTPAARPTAVVTSRPAPVPVPTPIRAATSATRPTAAAPQRPTAAVTRASVLEPEPVNPFELREQLAGLGSYGSPVPIAAAPAEAEAASEPPSLVTVPEAYQVAQAQPVAGTKSEAQPETILAAHKDQQYEEDAAEVLGLPVAEAEVDPESGQQAAGILPGEFLEAELINAVSWSDGDTPEVAIETTSDLMVNNQVVIPAETRMLATVTDIDEAGAIDFEITKIFMDHPLNIPPGSLTIQAEDGSTLRASRPNGRSGGSGLEQVLWGSAFNATDNVIESDDSLVGDLAGGLIEGILSSQQNRLNNRAAARAALANSRAAVWTLDAGDIRIFVTRYIALEENNAG